jgi:phosphoribosyl 1,2-cyclic phosphodiesterase
MVDDALRRTGKDRALGDLGAMSVQFAVLASGSRGNSTLIQSRGVGILIDVGLGPRVLRDRLRGVGSDWDRLAAVILTHTHRDHVDIATLRTLAEFRIPFFCHASHRQDLAETAGVRHLEQSRLLRVYDQHPFLLPNGLRAEPVSLQHDSGPTFGFRIEVPPDRRKKAIALGFLSDTGGWTPAMVDAVTDVDVLGVEFNHDVGLQRSSGRPSHLIARVLGDRGHLSNEQGADLVREVFARSGRNAVQHLVLLHLSGQCNHPSLAIGAANSVIRDAGRENRVIVHAARQNVCQPNFCVTHPRRASRPLVWHPGPGPAILNDLATTSLETGSAELGAIAVPF